MSLSKVVALVGLVSCTNPHQAPRVLYGSEKHAPVVMSSSKRTLHPRVKAESTNKCFFKDDNNSWCFQGISPILRSGWDIDQDTGTDYWTVAFKPYIQT